MLFKYAVIAAGTAAGIAICIRSYGAHFMFGWLFVIALPLYALSVAEQPLGLFQPQARQEQVFIYVWIFIALVELFLLWIPLVSFFVRSSRSSANGSEPTQEAESGVTREVGK